MKKSIVHIKVSKYFARQVNSRSSIDSLFKSINDTKRIVFDFSDIDFISRSSAHELLTLVDELSRKNYSISYLNLNPEQKLMLDKVASSIKSNYKTATYVNRLKFPSQSETDNFLMAI